MPHFIHTQANLDPLVVSSSARFNAYECAEISEVLRMLILDSLVIHQTLLNVRKFNSDLSFDTRYYSCITAVIKNHNTMLYLLNSAKRRCWVDDVSILVCGLHDNLTIVPEN